MNYCGYYSYYNDTHPQNVVTSADFFSIIIRRHTLHSGMLYRSTGADAALKAVGC
jgi:hypothetical protein